MATDRLGGVAGWGRGGGVVVSRVCYGSVSEEPAGRSAAPAAPAAPAPAARRLKTWTDRLKYCSGSGVMYWNSVCDDMNVAKQFSACLSELGKRITVGWWSRRPILKMSGGADSKYKSRYRATASGPDPANRQGPNDSLLLLDYLPWSGPRTECCSGSTVVAEGPESRDKSSTLARGPAPALAKGPAGLAKGSIYQNINKKSAKFEVFSN
ncbi:unnamed protein product [Diatraea saccharalis]|uniref:Uncharacterized protein n=1 Tax=Diatraea saccharalis TaxID=40085 RepID=A0A9N9QP62_9NEOP|nr:unnamed protein product [Diatraea saccharalis]